MKKKGQALVEFVIIIPIFIMLVLAVIDVGHILYAKIRLEGDISEVISLYQNGLEKEEIINKLKIKEENKVLEIKFDDEFATFLISEDIAIMTPGLNFVFNNPYNLKVSRSIINDSE